MYMYFNNYGSPIFLQANTNLQINTPSNQANQQYFILNF